MNDEVEDLEDKDLDPIEIDSLKLILTESEKKLEETTKTAELLNARAFNLIQLFVLIAAGSLAYLISNQELMFVWILSIIGLGMSLVVLFKCIKAYNIYGINTAGFPPKNLIKHDFSEIRDNIELHLIRAMLKSIQKSIKENSDLNTDKAKILRQTHRVCFWGLVLLTVFGLLVHGILWGDQL